MGGATYSRRSSSRGSRHSKLISERAVFPNLIGSMCLEVSNLFVIIVPGHAKYEAGVALLSNASIMAGEGRKDRQERRRKQRGSVR